MSERFVLPISGALSVSHVVFNDTTITLKESEADYVLTAQRGSDVQELKIPKCECQTNPKYNESLTAETAQQHAGELLFIDENGTIAPLTLGDGLEIVDGKLTVTGAKTVKAICGEAVCGEIICGNV